jgi:hypothetical protein
MNPQDQQIAIAEACGFRKEEPWLDGRECWGHKDHPPHVGFEEIPDCLNDLNAMHEAELLKVDSTNESLYRNFLVLQCGEWKYHKATAAQRAEALLKTLNLWKP